MENNNLKELFTKQKFVLRMIKKNFFFSQMTRTVIFNLNFGVFKQTIKIFQSFSISGIEKVYQRDLKVLVSFK